MEAKDFLIGLSATFLLWCAIILIASCRLMWSNWSLITRWFRQDRDMKMRLSLWVGIPVLIAYMLWMRTVAVCFYLDPAVCSVITPIFQIIALVVVLFSFVLLLRWVFDRAFVVSSNQDPALVARERKRADMLWLAFLAIGALLAIVFTILSVIY